MKAKQPAVPVRRPRAGTSAADRDTFFIIPHTHWEGAVFKTREEYLEMGLPHILRALKLLKQYPEYRFTLDQSCYIEPFLERYPAEAADFRRFVDEGRLAIVGGTIVMLDVNMPGGESFVRQVLYGKGSFRRRLGVDVTVSWQLDTFGHHAQMPQLLKLAGYTSFWFFRGVSAWDGKVPSEFVWAGLDGSRIDAFWLPYGYAHLSGLPDDFSKFKEFAVKQYEMLAPFARGAHRVALAGPDVYPPEEQAPRLVEEFNHQTGLPCRLQFAVPAGYEAAVAARGKRPVVTGEMNPIFQGTYSSRIELKQRTRELECWLTTAEKLGVLLRCAGAPADDGILWRAWEPMLFNQAHDLMSGVMTDRVYADTLRGYDFAQRIATDETNARLRNLAAHIDTRGEGAALVVFNALSWPRTDIVLANVGFSAPAMRGVALVGPDGREVPVQIMKAHRYPDGAIAQAEIAFVARDVPALGHAVYRVRPAATEAPTAAAAPAPVLENEFYRLACDPATGAIASVVVKSADWNALAGAGNIVALEEDRGDLWELYKTLDGGSRIAMRDRHPAPKTGHARFSTDQAGTPGVVLRGPVVSEFSVAHPFGAQGTFKTTIRLYAGLPRIDMRTQILNRERNVRYRVLFPTSIRRGQRVDEIPFGAIARPDGIEFPAQNWIDYGDGARGVALLNRGLPGNNVADGVMMLSLLRSVCIAAYGFGGGYEPGMSSDTGFEEGPELSFDYALVPHTGGWQAAGIHRAGHAFNQPLLAVMAAPQAGRLPPQHGFLELNAPGIVVSTLKRGESGDAVLRMYEAVGQATRRVRIKFAVPLEEAEEVNLMEDPGRKLALHHGALQLDFKPFEIKTVKLRFKSQRKRTAPH